MKKMKIALFIGALAVPLAVGLLSAALSSNGMSMYGTMAKPPLSPPAWAFSVAWSILYIMMGIASYFVIVSDVPVGRKIIPLALYALQLIMNFFWSIIFFNEKMYLFALFWLFIMLCIVITGAIKFFTISKLAAYLLIPYILWLTFAAYLNFGAYVLSK